MRDVLPASLAALGAVIGLFFGGNAGSLVSPSATWPIVVGALSGAVICAWLGVRLSTAKG